MESRKSYFFNVFAYSLDIGNKIPIYVASNTLTKLMSIYFLLHCFTITNVKTPVMLVYPMLVVFAIICLLLSITLPIPIASKLRLFSRKCAIQIFVFIIIQISLLVIISFYPFWNFMTYLGTFLFYCLSGTFWCTAAVWVCRLLTVIHKKNK
jgi:hypothetical protein